jgi:hypothetical protein
MILVVIGHELILNGRLVNVIPFDFLSKSVNIMLLSVFFHYLLKSMSLMVITLLTIPSQPPFNLMCKPERRKLPYRRIDNLNHLSAFNIMPK